MRDDSEKIHLSPRTVGILGGMGPEATVDFISKVIALTPANCDQDHLPMLIYSNPLIPNRQAATTGSGEDPGPAIGEMGLRLENAGADFLVMPCNSAHAFADRLRQLISIPLISIVNVTAERCSRYGAVGVLATDGCLISGVYQSAFEQRSIRAIVPSASEVARLMRLINAIKAGNKTHSIRIETKQLANSLVSGGAEAIVAGCTEIPLVLRQGDLDVPVISSTDILAQSTVAFAKGQSDAATLFRR